jgi:predicted RNase H-like nuclease (RuvC/YqgF family)
MSVILIPSFRCSGQASDSPSLGDVARKQRHKAKDTKNPASRAKKVVTDEDMPAHAEGASDNGPPLDGPHSEMAVSTSSTDVLRTGEQWKRSIAQQKSAVADLKSRIDKLNASIRFVSAGAYRNGVEYNKSQAHKQQEVDRMQTEMDEQKKSLEQVQETARRAEYGSRLGSAGECLVFGLI